MMFSYKRILKFLGAAVVILSVMACDPMSGRETAGEYIDDATITSKVIAAIIDDPVLKKAHVNVETLKKVVQLSGWVDSDQSRERAGAVARGVTGVSSVRNNLIVQ
ncbi:BON domain-containing protein [Thalassospiraceae bacterium LMO-SO8]|nr:BON domain-containing protein [Alphaproteobacteria bacterium LMO-S08]WND76103.1 BON domain-containing protein [Thalassospiraceae bacterium LMO-SO8]